MKIVAIYRENAEFSRQFEEFLLEVERKSGQKVEVRNPDRPENEFFLRAYDVVEYPTILAVTDDGRMIKMWRGRNLPLSGEVAHYAA